MKYISAPYSKAKDKDLQISIISRYSAHCLKLNQHVICPLTMGHNFSKHADLPHDSDWWMPWCIELLSVCTEMDVLCLPGWGNSTGVLAEIKFALEHNIKVNYITIELDHDIDYSIFDQMELDLMEDGFPVGHAASMIIHWRNKYLITPRTP